jgi:hypothetical protein
VGGRGRGRGRGRGGRGCERNWRDMVQWCVGGKGRGRGRSERFYGGGRGKGNRVFKVWLEKCAGLKRMVKVDPKREFQFRDPGVQE